MYESGKKVEKMVIRIMIGFDTKNNKKNPGFLPGVFNLFRPPHWQKNPENKIIYFSWIKNNSVLNYIISIII